jgi:hypothetical protein
MEVMIAGGILFMCLFAILALVSTSLRSARLLQTTKLDASMVAAQLYIEMTRTNQVTDMSGSGDFGDAFPNVRYEWELEEIETNGLCQFNVLVLSRSGGRGTDSHVTMLLYLPNLRQTGFGRGVRR